MPDFWMGREGNYDPELVARWHRVRSQIANKIAPPAVALWCPFCRALNAKRIVVAAVYADGSDRQPAGVYHETPLCEEWKREPDPIKFLAAMRERIAP